MPPPDGHLLRASAYVMLSRFRDYESLRLLRPLWPAGNIAARDAVIDAWHAVASIDADTCADMQRLEYLAKLTSAKYTL